MKEKVKQFNRYLIKLIMQVLIGISLMLLIITRVVKNLIYQISSIKKNLYHMVMAIKMS